MKYFLSLLILLHIGQAFAQENKVQIAFSERDRIAIKLADEQLEGYNNRDIEAFLAPYSEDVEVYTFPDILRYKGKDTMRINYSNMFNSTADLHCKIVNRLVQRDFLIDQEEVIKNGVVIHAVAIYKIENDKISKVYFLP